MFTESCGGNGSYIKIGSVSLLMNGASGTFSLKSDKMICRSIALGGVLYLRMSNVFNYNFLHNLAEFFSLRLTFDLSLYCTR